MQYSTAYEGIRHINRALELDGGRGRLGDLADRIREVRDRAINHMSHADGDDATYNEAMTPDEQTARPGGE
ncbi:MAG: hypothetical protein GY778_05035 [bacterium]|nr:hypothetical protein [bacterium]